MALTNYADLLSSMQDWIERTDLWTFFPDYVTLFEADFNRSVTVREMEAISTLTPDSNGQATLPTDYINWRRLTYTGNPRRELDFVSPEYFEAYPTHVAGLPSIFTIEGSTIRIAPLSQTDLQLAYYQRLPALATASTNWLMTKYPDVYLFGSLMRAAAFAQDAGKAAQYKAMYEEAMAKVINRDVTQKGPSAMRVYGSSTP